MVVSDYTLHNQSLSRVDTAKYLGVSLSSNLSWNKHIEVTKNKGNRMLGLLKRNLNVGSTEMRSLAYKTIVRPVLEYSSSVWDPYTSDNILILESVQRRAARYVCRNYRNTSSVTGMLENLRWPTLSCRRKISRLSMMHKITYNHVAIKKDSYLVPRQGRSSRHFNTLAYRQPTATVSYYKHSFFPGTIPLWNSLQEDIVLLKDTNKLKSRIQAEMCAH